MTPTALLDRLRALGVEVRAEGDKLRYRAPAGVLTPDLRQAIREHKAALLELLRPATPSPPAACTVRFVGPSPVVFGPRGVDPIDFRFDVDKQAWVHDPGWWRGPAQAREPREAARDALDKPQEPR